MNNSRLFAVSLGTISWALSVSTPSLASGWMRIPGGQILSECVHPVPQGATIDAANNNVVLGGSIIAHYDPCPINAVLGDRQPGQVGSGIGSASLPTFNGYVEEWSQDFTSHLSGDNLDYVSSSWVVPPAPTDPSAT